MNANVTDPAVAVFLLAVIGGIVQAIRPIVWDSRWLPVVSIGMGVIVTILAAGSVSPQIILLGLGYGAGVTFTATLVLHHGNGTAESAHPVGPAKPPRARG